MPVRFIIPPQYSIVGDHGIGFEFVEEDEEVE